MSAENKREWFPADLPGDRPTLADIKSFRPAHVDLFSQPDLPTNPQDRAAELSNAHPLPSELSVLGRISMPSESRPQVSFRTLPDSPRDVAPQPPLGSNRDNHREPTDLYQSPLTPAGRR